MTFKAMHYLKLYPPNIQKKKKKTPYCRQLCLLFDAHIPQSILGKITVRSKITTLTCNSIKMSRYSGFLCIPCCFSQWNPLMLELSLICLSPHHPFFFLSFRLQSEDRDKDETSRPSADSALCHTVKVSQGGLQERLRYLTIRLHGDNPVLCLHTAMF